MNKFIKLSLILVALGLSACSKDDKNNGGNYGYAPNSCYRNQAGYGRYQWTNGVCLDIQTNQNVDPTLCNYNNNGFNNGFNNGYGYNNGFNNYDPGCNFSWNNNFYNGQPQFNSNPCSRFNNGFDQYYPIYYPEYGGYVCAGFTTYFSWGTPIQYNGYNNWYYGCTPGSYTSGCNCANWGGTLGYASLGICY